MTLTLTVPRKARSFFLLSLDASWICTLISLDSLTVLEVNQRRWTGPDRSQHQAPGSVGANENVQIKGFVPVWTEGLFDDCRRCNLHRIHKDEGNWIGKAEHVALDESVRGDDCTIMIGSKLEAVCAVVDGSRRPAASQETHQSI